MCIMENFLVLANLLYKVSMGGKHFSNSSFYICIGGGGSEIFLFFVMREGLRIFTVKMQHLN